MKPGVTHGFALAIAIAAPSGYPSPAGRPPTGDATFSTVPVAGMIIRSSIGAMSIASQSAARSVTP